MMPSWAAEDVGLSGEMPGIPGAVRGPLCRPRRTRHLTCGQESANSHFTEHARLKDHVSSMEGGLEAKVNEGGKHLAPSISHLSPVPTRYPSSMPTSFRRRLHLDRPYRLSRGRPHTHVTPPARSHASYAQVCLSYGASWRGELLRSLLYEVSRFRHGASVSCCTRVEFTRGIARGRTAVYRIGGGYPEQRDGEVAEISVTPTPSLSTHHYQNTNTQRRY